MKKTQFIIICLFFGISGSGFAQNTDRLSSFSNWVKTTPKYLSTGLSYSVSDQTNQIILGTALLGASLAYTNDAKVQQYFQSNKPLPKTLSRFGDYYGGSWVHWSLMTTVLCSSWLQKDSGQTAFRKFEFASSTILTNAAVTYFLKYSVGRERPNSENYRSFPSGHTSNSFAAAAVIHELYGDTFGAIAYAIATMVGISRINDNKHYLSDVLVGAGIGTAIGRGFAIHFNRESEKIQTGLSGLRLRIIVPIS